MKKLEISSKITYYLGARRKVGDYTIPDKETGEVKDIHVDKYRLFFIVPINQTETDFKEGYGVSNTHYDVNTEDLPFVFGKDEKGFKTDILETLKGEPVILDIATTTTSKGTTTVKLRGIMTVADFVSSMSEK